MNTTRRESIRGITDKLHELLDEISGVLEEETEAHDNMPDSIQESERGEASQNAIDNLQSAYDSGEELINFLEEAQA